MLNTIVEVGRVKYIYSDAIELEIPSANNMLLVVDISETMMKHVNDYLKVEDLVGIKAHLETNNKVIKCVADKITFLSSKKGGEIVE